MGRKRILVHVAKPAKGRRERQQKRSAVKSLLWKEDSTNKMQEHTTEGGQDRNDTEGGSEGGRRERQQREMERGSINKQRKTGDKRQR
jgi:hypothetical protein